MRWLWTVLAALLWSYAGWRISGAMPYNSASAFLTAVGLIGGTASAILALTADERVQAVKRTERARELAEEKEKAALPEPRVLLSDTIREWRERHECAQRSPDGTLVWHGYPSNRDCPVHGIAVTPVKGPAVPPLEQLAKIAGEHSLNISRAVKLTAAADAIAREKQAAELRALKRQEDEYVPAGQEELTASLLEYMNDQVQAAADRWDAITEPEPRYHWRMSPEWAAEARKIKGGTSYPVQVSEEYGAPELTLDP